MNMSAEIIIYLLIASACMVWRRILSGLDNAVFYAKGRWNENGRGAIGKKDHPEPDQFRRLVGRYMENIHFIETPSWYAQAGIYFPLALAVLRLSIPGAGFWMWLLCAGIALLLTMACSGLANPFYQGLINVGSGLPYINKEETRETEFALNIFGKRIAFWRRRGFSGRGRIFVAAGSALLWLLGMWVTLKKAKQ